ncbi:MAG: ATP-binding cassette domain-containing protein [Eubacteriaceae bacterium]|nr:ATP-binding cassette domain-containing protein [Eubacteriaceae bacterium]
MIQVTDLAMSFGADTLFKDVSLTFQKGNCYGVIGANGAGKTTFLKILSGELEPSRGHVSVSSGERISVLKQDHSVYNSYSAFDTIVMGNEALYALMRERDEIYAKSDFSDEDGMRAAELEGDFAEMGGWEAESDASKIIQGLGLEESQLFDLMESMSERDKIKVLVAQALFGEPDILLMDEPTNGLDIASVSWLEDFLLEFEGALIVVSHDRHFLNTICTHIVDIDYTKMVMYPGNYEFWYESSQLMQRIAKQQAKKRDERAKELMEFIARFSANKSKSKQATSRKKMLEKLTVEQMPASSRKYPFVAYEVDREAGKDILTVSGLSKSVDGELVLNNISFTLSKGDKAAFVGEYDIANTVLFKILNGEMEPDSGSYKWGVSITKSYFPQDNTEYFKNGNISILKWLEQYSKDTAESYLRGMLGRMLFSQEEALKPVGVLSGGERVRCMLSRMMMYGANTLVMDQPTNHLDLEAITALNNGLVAFKGNIVFSSHDHEFISTIANRIIELSPEGIEDYKGTFDEYLESKLSLAK